VSDELEPRSADLDQGYHLLGDDEPEFIMVGIRRPGGITLFVSKDVVEAKFLPRVVGHDAVEVKKGMRPAILPRVEIVVGAKMTSFEQVLGDNYLEALKSLAGWWEQRGDPRALPPA